MKKIKMLATVLAAVVGLAMIPDANAVTAKAEGPVTYHVKYSPDNDEWRFQTNTSTYDENAYSRELYYLLQDIKDGDVVVVYNDSGSDILLDLGNVHLSNLTIGTGCKWSMVKVGSVDDFYATIGSSSSITGNVTNAYVYLNALCNFNNDVKYLSQYFDQNGEDGPDIGCGGKVGQFTSRSYSEANKVFYTIYEVTSLYVKDGVLQEGSIYSREPVATPTTSPTTSSSASNNSDEYDEVPKTGQSNLYLWLFGTAAACFVCSGLLKKTSR